METTEKKINIKYISKSLMEIFKSGIDLDNEEVNITSPELKNAMFNVEKNGQKTTEPIVTENKSSKNGGFSNAKKVETKGINLETLNKMRENYQKTTMEKGERDDI